MTQQNEYQPAIELRRMRGAYQALAGLSTLLLFYGLIAAISSLQTFGGSLDLFRQSTQQSRNTGSGDGDEKDVRALEAGKPIKRELAGRQRHAYRIKLGADQFLKVIVEQQGIDVVAQVSGPDGKQILEFDSESRSQGREEVSLVSEVAGDYGLIVRPQQEEAPSGNYEIRIEELRVATDTDRALHDARKRFEESLKLQRAGKNDEALLLAERALEIRERLLGTEHRDVAAAINSLAGIYTARGEYVKAEPLFRRALAIREKDLGKDHLDTAQSLNNLAFLYALQDKHAEAEPLLKRALDISEKELGKDHPIIAMSLNSLAALYRRRGIYEEAEPLYLRALNISEKRLGKDHTITATCLSNLALLYASQGKYAEAEPLYKRALDIREKKLGKDHLDTANTLNNLALLYASQGKYEEAEPLYRRSLDIREKAPGGKDKPITATSLNNLAVLYDSQGKYAEAESLLKRALDIREKALRKDHPDTAICLNNLAALYRRQGKYAEAEPLFKRALNIFEKELGKDHPDTAQSLNGLALLYASQGKYGEAESLYMRALDIREKKLGQDHLDTVTSLNNLAVLYASKGDFVQAVKFQSLANSASERNLAHNLVIGSERQKLAYLAILPQQTDRTISLHLHSAPDDPVARDLAATLILQRKGRTLDATSENLNALRSRLDIEDQALLDRLTETRSQIARLALGGPQRITAEQYQVRIKELEDQAEKYMADISRRSKEFSAQNLPVTLEAVRAAIPPDSALVEFTSYRPFNAKATKGEEAYGQPRYVAYVLQAGGIEWKELGEAKAIDTAIAALRKASRDPKRGDVKRLARAVDAKVFQPVRPLLGDMTRLLISPDGSLNLIPFAALVDERRRYMVERYSISYLASGRDLLRLQVRRESRGGPLVVAAPDFGRRSQVEAPRLEKQEKDASDSEVKEESARSAIKEFYFPPLPFAEREGETLRALLAGATLLTKRQATKAALSQIHSPSLLHIATHGFFLKDLKSTLTGAHGNQSFSDNPEQFTNQLERNGLLIENPLLRSGLALAGANERKEDDNGILTALEVTGLNLWGTKLVTLSACDTGVGEVKNGDGVHGMRRALALAGSETQVMSLWAVQDKATRDLMVAYYSKLAQGQGRGEALRQAQLEMLKKVNRRHPYFWASFIQSGEWANLEGKR